MATQSGTDIYLSTGERVHVRDDEDRVKSRYGDACKVEDGQGIMPLQLEDGTWIHIVARHVVYWTDGKPEKT